MDQNTELLAQQDASKLGWTSIRVNVHVGVSREAFCMKVQLPRKAHEGVLDGWSSVPQPDDHSPKFNRVAAQLVPPHTGTPFAQ